MKIGLNCQYILIDNPAGPERFTLNLYKHLAKVDTDNKYILYFNRKPSEQLLKELKNDNSNFSYKVLRSFILWTQFRLAFELLINPVDVFFTPIHTLPFVRNNKTKFVAMIHDSLESDLFPGVSLKTKVSTIKQFEEYLNDKKRETV